MIHNTQWYWPCAIIFYSSVFLLFFIFYFENQDKASSKTQIKKSQANLKTKTQEIAELDLQGERKETEREKERLGEAAAREKLEKQLRKTCEEHEREKQMRSTGEAGEAGDEEVGEAGKRFY